MEYLMIFFGVFPAMLFLYFYVIPYILDYLEDVYTHFVRRRARRKHH